MYVGPIDELVELGIALVSVVPDVCYSHSFIAQFVCLLLLPLLARLPSLQ